MPSRVHAAPEVFRECSVLDPVSGPGDTDLDAGVFTLLGGIAGAALAGPLLLPVLGFTGLLQTEVTPLLLTTAAVLLLGRFLQGKADAFDPG